MVNIGLIRANEKIIYHTGYLAKDRDPEFSRLKRHEALDLDVFAKQLWRAYRKGEGVLTQCRIEEGTYSYMFTKK